MATIFAPPYFTALDAGGKPILNASLSFYASGTLDPVAVYADALESTPLPWPVVTDAAGRAPAIYLNGSTACRLIFRNAAGVPIRDVDPLPVSDDGLRADLGTSTSGGALVAYLAPFTGAIAGTVSEKLDGEVSIFDFMPHSVKEGIRNGTVVDVTGYINLATGAADPHIGNGSDIIRSIYVPPGHYKLGVGSTPVCIRKGQRLRGAGVGATYFDLSDTFDNINPIFVGGKGADGSIDPGGLPVEICDFFTIGGPVSFAVIDMAAVATGYAVHNLFMTSPGIGINAGGGDGKVYDCWIDQGLNGVILSGQNNIIRHMHFFNLNTDITVGNSYDCEINDCHSEYNQINSIVMPTSSTGIAGLKISGHKVVMNVAYTTHSGAIRITAPNAKAVINGLTTSNISSAAIIVDAPGSRIVVNHPVIDGARTNPLYEQNTAGGGLLVLSGTVMLNHPTFLNLNGQPITQGGTLDNAIAISGGQFVNCVGGATHVNVNNTNTQGGSSLTLDGVDGGGKLLFNAQSTVPVIGRDLRNWFFAPAIVATGRRGVSVPYGPVNLFKITLRANPNPSGGAYYKNMRVLAGKSLDNNGANVSLIKQTTIYNDDANTGTALALTVEFTPGGGPSLSGFSQSGLLSINWSSAYAGEVVDVQMEG